MKIKKALVTGGTSGIGLAICEELLQLGVEVYSVSRNPKKIKSQNNFYQIQLDLSDLNAASQFGDKFIEQYGTPDLLINNAGYGAFYEWKEFPRDEIEKQISVLLTAPVLLCKSFAPEMEKVEHATIVNITSLATLYPLPYMPLYNACKSGLSSFTQSMMLEYKTLKWIDFRLGDIRTSFNKSAPKQAEESQSDSMKRAWKQIEKQLDESPLPQVAARQVLRSLRRGRSGTIYGGGFFQARLAPFFESLLTNQNLIKILNFRYTLN
ncbi:SDR family NAD(P)-dependent oxidoreductase [Opitutales bacterium]|nr:SDR family NAD(P)-dependent oxidoreductase [Opitutales bacterium]